MTNPQYISYEEVAHTFIRQYEAFINNELEGTVFTDDQMTAMVGGIKTHPEEMCLFFIQAGGVISMNMLGENNNYKKAYEAMSHYNSVVNSLLIRVVHILYNHGNGVEFAKPAKKKPPEYTMEHDKLFGGLDFNMPDWDQLNQ